MKRFAILAVLICCWVFPVLGQSLKYNSATTNADPVLSASQTNAIAGAISNAALISIPPSAERSVILYSNQLPWRIGGFGDSLGDDVIGTWVNDHGRGLGWNGGYLTVITNSFLWPLTFTHSGQTDFVFQDTNWFTEHFTMGNGASAVADVTFDSGGRFVYADTFAVCMAYNTNGGTWKVQVQTNGGAFTDITGTSNALTATPTGLVYRFNTNLGEWKMKVVNVAGTNVLIGAGMWASNRGGISPSALWRSGGSITDFTNVSTNVTIPILRDLGMTEWQWHALDYAIEITNALPFFCNTLTNVAPNAEGVFIGMHKVTDNAPGYPLGNIFVRNTVTARGFKYVDTEFLGDTNQLLRREWVDSGSAIHYTASGQYILADLVWRDGGITRAYNQYVTSRQPRQPAQRIVGHATQSSNIWEVGTAYTGAGVATNYVWIRADGTLVTATAPTFGGSVIAGGYQGNTFITIGANVISHQGANTIKFANVAGTDLLGIWMGGNSPSNGNFQIISSSTTASSSNLTVNLRSGDTVGWGNFGAGSYFLSGTNRISAPWNFNTNQMGATIFSDGTNIVVAFQNSANVRTTNKLSMVAWP